MGEMRLFPRVGRAALARIGIGRGIVYSPARRPTDATKRSLSAVLVCLVLVFGLSSPRVAGARSNVAPASPFLITFDGVNYHADSQSTASSYTGTLKFVMESAVTELNSGGGGIVNFAAGTFDFGSEYFKVYDLVNITFDGAGMNSTTIQNSSSDAADTEPFNFEGTDAVTISDLTVSAGGPVRSTSDAIDFDKGNNSTVERVKITASRGRGIVFDGKNAGWTSAGNTVRDCVIDGVADSGIEFLASTNNLVEGCTITNVARHGVEAGKSSPTAAQPNKKASDNVIRNNVIDNAGVDGIHVNSSDRNQILNNQITNSSNNVASADGIRISSSDSITCDENVVEGNVATDNQATKTQRYGLNISSALCNGTFVGGANNFIGNRLGPVNDLGTGTLYGPDTVPPTAPSGLTATGVYKTQIDLHWTASEDSVGVTGYEIWRDGSSLATIGAQTAYFDQTVTPGSTHSYQVRALDAAGNLSGFSNTATATTPTSGLLFHDGFETGDFSNWTQNNGLVIQQSQVFAGSYAAEGVSTGSAGASAYKQLAPSETDLYYVIRFKVLSQAQNVNLLRFRNNLAGANAIATLFVTSTSPSRVGMRNDVTAVSTTSTTVAAAGTWHTAQVHLNVNGTSSQSEVWIDETMVPELSQSGIDLGTNPIGRLELGDPSLNRTFDVALDEVAYDRDFIATTTASSQTLTVSKDFSPNNAATVSVSLSCTSGSVDASPKPASEGSPAVFTVSGFSAGATCSASEGVAPPGYTKNEATCQNVAIDAGPAGCTITNTLNSQTFTVSKDFIPDSAATVSVSVTCTSGSVDASPKNASEGSPAVFTVTGFNAGAACSAGESPVPAGYAESDNCQSVAIDAGPAACTITNQAVDPIGFGSASSAANANGGATTLVIPAPSGVANSDVLVAGITHKGGAGVTVTPPSGWTLVLRTNNGNDVSVHSYYHVVSNVASEPASYTWTFSNSQRASGGILRYTGVDPANPVQASSGCSVSCGNSVSVTAASVTTAVTNERVIGFFGLKKNGSFTAPGGMTERYDITNADSGGPATEGSDFTQVSAGATGTKTATASVSERWVAQLVALRPLTSTISAIVTVNKDFVPDSGETVSVSVTCTSGTVDASPKPASESSPAAFIVTGFTPGATCSASEGAAPAGYTKDEASCQSLALVDGGTPSCTITNTQTVGTIGFGSVSSAANAQAGATTLVIAVPPGVTNSDVLVAGITHKGGNDLTVTAPTGWTLVLRTDNGKDISVHSYYHVVTDAGSEPSSYTWTLSSSQRAAGGILRYTGVDTANPVQASSGCSPSCGNSTAVTAASVTTAVASERVIGFFGLKKNGSFTAPGGMTERYDVTNTDGGGPATESSDFTQASAGATGPKTATASVSEHWVAQLVALRPLTATSATFSVSKDFVPDEASTVSVSLSCSSGSVDASPKLASEGSPAVFTLTGFNAGATCSATEGAAPAGYTKNEASCQNVTVTNGGTPSCTITNTQTSATFTVNKDFVPDSASTVSVSLTCTSGSIDASPKPASEGAPAMFTVTGFIAGTTCSASEGSPPAGHTESDNCQNVTVTDGGTPSCTITNTLNSQTFTVTKDFVPDNTGVVSVSVTCTSGSVDASPKPASEGSPAVFTVTGFSAGATCSASEGAAPAGYTEGDDCQNVAIDSGPATCTITNTLNSETFSVSKDFVPDSVASVSVSVSCTSGAVDASPKPASEGPPAVFTVTGFSAGATCSATEGTAPAGYTKNEASCQGVAIDSGPASCTITNTQTSVTFTVNKDFVPDDPGVVSVSLSCTSGTPDASPKPASEGSPAVFTVSGFSAGATCSASESPVPAGYAESGNCQNVAIDAGPAGCTITNTPSSTTFTVNKNFVPDVPGVVMVSLTCTSGSVDASPKLASEASPAVFTITSFNQGATCTATENPAPPGFTKDETACQNVPITHGVSASCTIINNSAPTVVEVASFAARNTKLGVALTWRTRTERAVAGFNVWRVGNGRVVKLNRGLIRAKGAGGVSGASYRFVDRSAKANVRYTYRLQVVGFDGKRSWRASEKIRAAR